MRVSRHQRPGEQSSLFPRQFLLYKKSLKNIITCISVFFFTLGPLSFFKNGGLENPPSLQENGVPDHLEAKQLLDLYVYLQSEK